MPLDLASFGSSALDRRMFYLVCMMCARFLIIVVAPVGCVLSQWFRHNDDIIKGMMLTSTADVFVADDTDRKSGKIKKQKKRSWRESGGVKSNLGFIQENS